MQEEIEKIDSKEILDNLLKMSLIHDFEEYKLFYDELLKRLSKNNIEDKTLNKRPNWYNGTRQCIEANIDRPTPDSMNNIMAHIQTLVEFKLRDNIEEFKKKLIETIKDVSMFRLGDGFAGRALTTNELEDIILDMN